jgi:transposase
MLGTEIKAKFLPRDYDIFAGLDVDKKHIDVTFIDHSQRMKSMKIPYSADHLLAYTRRHYAGQRVAFVYEAGPTGWGLYDQITTGGYRCLVVTPSMVPTAPGQRVKTNRIDSRKLGTALLGGQLKSLHVPTEPYRNLRHLVHLRDTFVRQAVASQLRIKAMLLLENIPFPDARGRWCISAWKALQTLVCSAPLRFKLDRLLSAATFAHEQARQTTRELHRFCQSDPELAAELELLQSAPGIGRIIAPYLLASIGDWRQIRSVRQLSAFLGLVPCEDSTGDDVNRGSITRTGDRRLAAKLVQAAWAAIRHDPQLQEFYTRIYHRNPKPIAAQKAITAVANKLCRRIACILKEQRPYVVREASRSTEKEETATSQGTTRAPAETSALSAPCVSA